MKVVLQDHSLHYSVSADWYLISVMWSQVRWYRIFYRGLERDSANQHRGPEL